MGYDLAYAPEDLPHLVIYKNHTIMQICSSFFMPSLALCAISSTSRRAFVNGWQSTTMRASFQPRRFLRVALRAFHDQLQGTLASATAESASSIRQLSVVTAVLLNVFHSLILDQNLRTPSTWQRPSRNSAIAVMGWNPNTATPTFPILRTSSTNIPSVSGSFWMVWPRALLATLKTLTRKSTRLKLPPKK